MKVLVLQGNPHPDNDFDTYVESFCEALRSRGISVEMELLRDRDIRPCTGCFKCWIKTPGKCVLNDDIDSISQKYIDSDMVVLAAPLILGYFSSLMKNVLDRSIPLMHPHLEEIGCEMHHKKRYESYPQTGILIQKENDTDDEDIEIASDLFKRMCINMRSDLVFIENTEKKPEEIANAINIH